jgi:tRNA (adenine22-N1)-methyltransferase
VNKKLRTLLNMVDRSYELIVDTCCDHGKLGIAFLPSNKVLFVDQVPSIMKDLKRNLEASHHENYELKTLKAQDLEFSTKKNLICIAGIGGMELISILDSLLKKNDLSQSDFLLSPQYHLFEVRRFLADNGFKKIREEIIFEGKEDKRGRELFYLSLSKGEPIEPIGENLFDPTDEKNKEYFLAIYHHLKKKSPESEEFKLYQKLLKVLL